MDKQSVLIVEDDHDYAMSIAEVVESEFDVRIANTGGKAIELFSEERPDIVLLDIGLPDQTGHEVCVKMREFDHNHLASIIFVSGHNSLEEKLKAYQEGGQDFIAKPFAIKELCAKLNAVSTYNQERKALVKNEQESQNVAYQALIEASEHGRIIRFFRNIFSAKTEQQVLEELVICLKEFGLRSSLFVSTFQTLAVTDDFDVVSPIEQNIYELLRHKTRLKSFNHRSLVNASHISILIKNMPVEDEQHNGRINDFICIICEGVEEKLVELMRQHAIEKTLNEFKQIVTDISTTLDSTSAENISQLDHASLIVKELEQAFHFMDLSEDQEKHLEEVLEKGRSKTDTLTSFTISLRAKLLEMAEKLNQLA